MAIARDGKRSVVLIPYPFQGHITPMLQLGTIFHSKGFSVIVAHPDFNPPNPKNHPEFIFLPLEGNLSGFDSSPGNILALISAINQNCVAPLVDYLVPMMKDQEKYGRISCVIYDVIMNFGNSVANHLKIPSMVLCTCSAAFMQTYHTLLQLQAKNQIPLQESKILDPVPELHALRYKDLSVPANTEMDKLVLEFFVAMSNIGSSVAIIWNTAEVLDHVALSQLQRRYKVPFFPIGPFHKIATTSSTSYIKEDRSCKAWLDKQAPNSVLYISLGSLAVIEQKELEETAWGLANSGQPFLWVIRPSSVTGSEWIELLPEGFQDTVGERGHIVKWTPQKEVLAHTAVGGFLSHCGWNSTLESICEGVPIICRPYFADQLANTRYLTHVWKVGVELEQVTDRIVIERTIRMVMVGNEGKEMKQGMIELKQKLESAVLEGGSSCESLNDYGVHLVITLKTSSF